jgi:protein SCO1/2
VKRLLAVALLLAVAACGGGSGSSLKAKQTAALGYHGVETQPKPARPEFVLTDTAGSSYDFRQRTQGRPTYLYFGYTNCPDLCPTAMADVAAALRKAPKDEAAKAVVVFVTTDPKRDTGPVLRRWLDQFSTGFVGLYGTAAQLAKAQQAAGAQVAEPGPPVPTVPGHPDQHISEKGTAPHKHFGPLGYSVSHTAVIFAYDADDRLPVLYPGGVTPADIADDLPLLLDPTRASSG